MRRTTAVAAAVTLAGTGLGAVLPMASAAGVRSVDGGALGPAGTVLVVDSLARVEGAVRVTATLANRGIAPLTVSDAVRSYATHEGCVGIDLLDPATGKRGVPVASLAGTCRASKLPLTLASGEALTFVVDVTDPGGATLDVLPARTGVITGMPVTGAAGAEAPAAGYLLNLTPRSERLSTRVKQEATRVSTGATTSIDLETDVLFAVNSATLSPRAGRSLDSVTRLLKGQPGRRLGVYGHTDSTASDAYNLTLSKQRAAAVQVALASRLGAGWTYTVQGYGESRPLVREQSAGGAPDPAARALNRRVEVRILR